MTKQAQLMARVDADLKKALFKTLVDDDRRYKDWLEHCIMAYAPRRHLDGRFRKRKWPNRKDMESVK